MGALKDWRAISSIPKNPDELADISIPFDTKYD